MKITHSILTIFSFLFFSCAVSASSFFSVEKAVEDSAKYRGYRVELYNFEMVKKTGDWVKVRFSVVNTGRMDVKMEVPTVHWVHFNFDRSLFDEKLGGYRDHIRYQMAKDGFQIAIGELKQEVELKFPTILPSGAFPKESERLVSKNKKSMEPSPPKEAPRDVPIFAPEKAGDEAFAVHPDISGESEAKAEKVNQSSPSSSEKVESEKCPDLRFSDLRIVEEDEKWATLEYTLVNEGDAPYHLIETAKGRDDGLIIRAYISGVETLSRGALPIGGQIVQPGQGVKNKLEKGEEYQARIKLDIRKKTRYMKSLILKLDGAQYAVECDRKNNTAAVVLK